MRHGNKAGGSINQKNVLQLWDMQFSICFMSLLLPVSSTRIALTWLVPTLRLMPAVSIPVSYTHLDVYKRQIEA